MPSSDTSAVSSDNDDRHDKTALSSSSALTNDSLNYTVDYYYSYDKNNWFEQLTGIAVPALFGLIVLTGFVGNMVVVLVVSLYRRARTATSLLMLNLAVADLVFIVVCVPTTAANSGSGNRALITFIIRIITLSL